MNGGPSQVDTWDYKPELEKRDGQELTGFDKNTGFFTGNVGPLMKSPFKFAQHGQSGSWVSEIFPNLAGQADEMAFLHSCFTESNNHSPALFMMNTGMARMGFPCLGSWATYGLGSESQDLPAFVTMSDPLGRGLPKGYSQNWGAGFLPSVYQGTWLKPQGDAIDNLYRPHEMTDRQQRAQLDLLAKLNKHKLAQTGLGGTGVSPNISTGGTGVSPVGSRGGTGDTPVAHTPVAHALSNAGDPEFAARIESFELAYRMQQAAPEAIDIDRVFAMADLAVDE